MSHTDPLVRAARLARRVPGYRRARRAVVPRLRRSSLLRTLAHRLWAVRKSDRRGGVASSDITAGSLLGGVGTENLPVLGILALGVPAEALTEVVDEVAQEQLLQASFRPVFVVDQPAFAVTRRFSYVTELVLPRDGWVDEAPWLEYLARRLDSVQETYGVSSWLRVPPGGLDDVALAQLRSAC
ncbi:hypothetical protein GC722_17315 [Auraticoccus sp. F435]|uniref:Uncharacterized protein n=1 Tax=Auraticoccus cholistanensis TaxID=2656650 RepID=A0A6A9V2G3_9ACTN|nr:hypothetical protein [Auraticoccus cholistanensis]MVA77759.1 hypothetical protein [Auraticoccus cholistanensis]